MSGMVFHKWFIEDVDRYASMLTPEQIGLLFLAVMQYLKTGEKATVPPEIAWPFGEQCQKVDGARAKYEIKSEINARNGAKGGKQKGINAAKARAYKKLEPEEPSSTSPPVIFKPLSKSDFLAIAGRYVPHAKHSLVEEFYGSVFVASGWKLDDEFPVASYATVIAALCVAFAEVKFFGDRNEDWQVFLEMYSTLRGEVPYPLFEEFAKTYRGYNDKPGGVWMVNGNEYSEYYDAVHEFFDDE